LIGRIAGVVEDRPGGGRRRALAGGVRIEPDPGPAPRNRQGSTGVAGTVITTGSVSSAKGVAGLSTVANWVR
jgi:hypothetical protein